MASFVWCLSALSAGVTSLCKTSATFVRDGDRYGTRNSFRDEQAYGRMGSMNMRYDLYDGRGGWSEWLGKLGMKRTLSTSTKQQY